MSSSELRLRHLILRDVEMSTLNHVLLYDSLHNIITLNLQVRSVSLSLRNMKTICGHIQQ